MYQKIELIKRQMEYFQPTEEWHPHKYNLFHHRLEVIINDLLVIQATVEKSENSPENGILKKEVSSLLEKYQTLREKYY